MRRLDSALIKLGYSIWVDIRNIESGHRWTEDVQRGLDECSLMILIISQAAMDSSNVRDEWEYFKYNSKTLIPILYKPTDNPLPFHLQNVQHIDFSSQNFDNALQNLQLELYKKGLKPNSEKPATKIKSNKAGNIFWICHDLMELTRWLLEGISKEWIDVGLRQSRHHAIEIGLDEGIISKIEQLIHVTKLFSDQDWNEGTRRQQYAREVTILFNVIAQEIQASDPDFNSGPG
jgi:hypothetical protein